MNQYILHVFDITRDIIIVVRDINDPYAQVDMYKPRKLIKEDNEDIILITQLQGEAKDCVKKLHILNNNTPKIYGILCGQYNPGLQNEVHGDPDYNINSDLFDCFWLM